MGEFKDYAKEFILIESFRTIRRHIKSEKEVDEILKSKFKLTDEDIKILKEKEKEEKKEKRWSL